MKFDPTQLLWEQKYRPQTIEDCVLPDETKKYFLKTIEDDVLQNLLLTSYCPGTGKTTVAMALLSDMNYEYIFSEPRHPRPWPARRRPAPFVGSRCRTRARRRCG